MRAVGGTAALREVLDDWSLRARLSMNTVSTLALGPTFVYKEP